MIDLEALVEKIPECGCWIWTKTVDRDGYGRYGGVGPLKNKCVHRLSHELYIGPIPDGYHVDHLCYVRSCVNPYHLEAVTPKENMHRMMRHGTWKKPPGSCDKFTCLKGHAWTPENTLTRKDGKRRCIACRKVYDEKRNADRRAKRLQNFPKIGITSGSQLQLF